MVGYLHWIHLPMLAHKYLPFNSRCTADDIRLFTFLMIFMCSFFLQRNRSLSYGEIEVGIRLHIEYLYICKLLLHFWETPDQTPRIKKQSRCLHNSAKNSWIFLFSIRIFFHLSLNPLSSARRIQFPLLIVEHRNLPTKYPVTFTVFLLISYCVSQLYLRSDHWKSRVKIASLNRPTYSVRAEVTNETERETRERKSL